MAHERAWLLALVSLGLVLRLLAVTLFAVEPTQDAASIEQLGRALAEGRGYALADGIPDTVLPPGAPALIGALYGIFGPSRLAVTVSQGLFDLGACMILWFWIRQRLSPRMALFTLAFAVTSLSAIGSARIPRGECLGTALLVVALVSFDLSRTRTPLRWLAGAGIACGFLTLFRWNFSLLPLVLAPFLAFRQIPPRIRILSVAVFLTANAAIVAPWMLRNYLILGEPVLSTQTGITLYSSHFRAPGQPYGNNTHDAITERAALMPPLEGSHYLVKSTLRGLQDDPKRLVTQYPMKLFWLVQPFDWEILSWPVLGTRSFNATYFIVALMALLGLRDAVRQDRALTILLLLPIAYLAALSLPFYGSPRFRSPAEPFLMPLAAFGLAALIRKWRGTRAASLSPSGSVDSQSPEASSTPKSLRA